MKANRASDYANKIRENSNAYHDGRVGHDVFAATNEALWREIESAGMVALVSAHLRFPTLAEVQP